MTEHYKKIGQSVLPNGANTTVYTKGVTINETIVKHIRIVNNDTVDRAVKLFQDGTGDVNTILPLVSIDAGGWAEFEGTILIDQASGTLTAFVDSAGVTNKVTVTVYGLELS